jgi:hypothetical protein
LAGLAGRSYQPLAGELECQIGRLSGGLADARLAADLALRLVVGQVALDRVAFPQRRPAAPSRSAAQVCPPLTWQTGQHGASVTGAADQLDMEAGGPLSAAREVV